MTNIQRSITSLLGWGAFTAIATIAFKKVLDSRAERRPTRPWEPNY